MPPEYFRAGAGAVIVNAAGLVLALERKGLPGAWQLPQGGLARAEDPLAAAYREIAEETGIGRDDLRLLDAKPELLAYELPAKARSEKTGRGQTNYWFLFRFTGRDDAIDIIGGGEFGRWQWMPATKLQAKTVDFRRPVYRRLIERFRPHLAPGEAPQDG